MNPDADDKQLVRLGKWVIGLLVLGSAGLTIMVFDPNTNEPFMNYVLGHQAKLVSGLVAAFIMGMLWSRSTPTAGLVSILTGVAVSYLLVSYLLPGAYAGFVEGGSDLGKQLLRHLGPTLNAFHSVFVASLPSRTRRKASTLGWD